MDVPEQVLGYFDSLPGSKREEMEALHQLILRIAPDAPLWFLDGKDETGKTVSNPNVGYGHQTMKAAGGKTREFYKVGISANTSGISVYVMGLEDKKLLSERFGGRIGKAGITGYCIKVSSLKNIDLAVLEEAIRFGMGDRP